MHSLIFEMMQVCSSSSGDKLAASCKIILHIWDVWCFTRHDWTAASAWTYVQCSLWISRLYSWTREMVSHLQVKYHIQYVHPVIFHSVNSAAYMLAIQDSTPLYILNWSNLNQMSAIFTLEHPMRVDMILWIASSPWLVSASLGCPQRSTSSTYSANSVSGH